MKAMITSFILMLSFTKVFAQDFWQQTNGPYGGTIFSLAYSNAGNIFCGTITGGGLYKSTDNGNTWFKVFGNDRNSWSWTITADRNDDIFASCSGYGLIKSTDEGNTWTQLTSLLTPRAIAINSMGHIFAGLSTGALYRSTNGGENWTQVNFGANGVNKILINDNGFIYAAFPPFLRMSTDNGDTWVQINYSGMSGGNDLAIDSTGNLLACNSNGIFRTSNNGTNWDQISNLNSVLSIAVSGNGDYYAGNNYGKIIKSTNSGLSWVEIYNNQIQGNTTGIRDIMIKPDGKIFAGVYYLGLFRSIDNGINWFRINNGLTNQRVSIVASNGNAKLYAGTFHDGLFASSNSGNLWTQIGLTNKYVFSIGFNGALNIFVYTPSQQGGLYRSTDSGLNWEQTGNGLSLSGNINIFRTINGTIFCASGNGIYKSSDNGSNWNQSGLAGINVTFFDNNRSNYLFAGTSEAIFRSIDLGNNWVRLDSLGYIKSMCIQNPDNLFVALWNGNLYRSTNNGNNWMLVNTGVAYYNLICNSIGNIFASDYDGTYKSVNNGLNWIQINSGLGFTDITGLALDSSGYIYAGTWGAGVFRSVQSTVSIKIITTELPSTFSLSQNYPNPFNPMTNIRFDLPKSGLVKLIIYDLLGREITTLVNQKLQAGSYSVYWDGSNYPSGVYFYKLVVGDASAPLSVAYSETKKMVLVK